MADTYKILVSDKLAKEGIAVFQSAGPEIEVDVRPGLKPDEIKAIIGQYHGLAIRSGTTVTADLIGAAAQLKVVGRAGIGVDNVDVDAASQRGILVMNTPEGNVVTTAEHAIALMCSLARKIPAATASMKAGNWEKSKFQGRELFHKVLGVVGLGNIGRIVANRGLGLKMRVIAYDPFVTKERAREMGVELVDLATLLDTSDFVTLHVPLLDATRNLIGRAAIEKMKKGAFLINAARGGLVDEVAAAEALRSGKLAGAAFDVFVDEPPPKDHPFLGLDNVVLTPHLGASTEEAQVNVSIAVAEQMVAYLLQGVVRNAVNAPAVSPELMERVGPYLRLGGRLGRIAGQLHKGGVKEVRAIYAGGTAEIPSEPITAAMLTGLLETALGRDVNPVSAPFLAKERGIEVVEERTSRARDFTNAVGLRVKGDQASTELVGALFGEHDVRIVSLNGQRLEIVPEGHVLLMEHRDRPGMIGAVGSILGRRSVNISRLTLSQSAKGGIANAAISVDGAVDREILDEVAAIPGIEWVRHLDLG